MDIEKYLKIKLIQHIIYNSNYRKFIDADEINLDFLNDVKDYVLYKKNLGETEKYVLNDIINYIRFTKNYQESEKEVYYQKYNEIINMINNLDYFDELDYYEIEALEREIDEYSVKYIRESIRNDYLLLLAIFDSKEQKHFIKIQIGNPHILESFEVIKKECPSIVDDYSKQIVLGILKATDGFIGNEKVSFRKIKNM